jgi:thioredoxin reductase (NADPH)
MTHIYETIILGGGPAGLSAALYAGRGKLDTLLIEKGSYGGQVATTYEVDNYPGTDIGITGPQLADKMRKQAETFGTKFVKEDIVNVELQEKIKKITTTKGEYLGKTVIIATGASPKMVGFKGEAELRGRGVSYCATCDADFFTDLPIAVIGGGDSAIQEALYLAKFGSKVTIIHRRQDSVRHSISSTGQKPMKKSTSCWTVSWRKRWKPMDFLRGLRSGMSLPAKSRISWWMASLSSWATSPYRTSLWEK